MSLERTALDIGFLPLIKVQVCLPSEKTFPQNHRHSLISTSKYGLIFMAYPDGFKTAKTDDLVNKNVELGSEASRKVITDFKFNHSVNLGHTPLHISLNSDQSIVCVIVKKNDYLFGLFYDINSFALKTVPSAFLEYKISDNKNDFLSDFSWNPNPDISKCFVISFSSGVTKIFEIIDDCVKVIGTSPSKDNITCHSWSPKGKQLVVGNINGNLTQYDMNFTVKRQIPVPTIFIESMMAIDIFWLSTFSFFIVYSKNNGNNEDSELSIVLINAPKGETPKCINYGDICFSYDVKYKAKYYIKKVKLWDGLIVITSANSNEVALIGKGKNDAWQILKLDDSVRASTPLTEQSEDTYPLGIDLDYTSTASYQNKNKNETQMAVPITWLLTDNWQLIGFRLYYENQQPIVHAPKALQSSKSRIIKKSPKMTTTNVQNYDKSNLASPVTSENTVLQPKTKFQDAPLSTNSTPSSPGVARTLKFDDTKNQTTLNKTVLVQHNSFNSFMAEKLKKFQANLLECDEIFSKFFKDTITKSYRIIDIDRMNSFMDKIDSMKEFCKSAQSKLNENKESYEDIDTEMQQNSVSYNYLLWKFKHYKDPKIKEQLITRPVEPILKRNYENLLSNEIEFKQKLETMLLLISEHDNEKKPTKAIRSELIISALKNNAKTIQVYKEQVNYITNKVEFLNSSKNGESGDDKSKNSKNLKYKDLKTFLQKRKSIRNIQYQSTNNLFTLSDASLKNDNDENTILPNLESTKEVQFGPPVAQSTPFIKSNIAKENPLKYVKNLDGKNVSPKPIKVTKSRNLPSENLNAFKSLADIELQKKPELINIPDDQVDSDKKGILKETKNESDVDLRTLNNQSNNNTIIFNTKLSQKPLKDSTISPVSTKTGSIFTFPQQNLSEKLKSVQTSNTVVDTKSTFTFTKPDSSNKTPTTLTNQKFSFTSQKSPVINSSDSSSIKTTEINLQTKPISSSFEIKTTAKNETKSVFSFPSSNKGLISPKTTIESSLEAKPTTAKNETKPIFSFSNTNKDLISPKTTIESSVETKPTTSINETKSTFSFSMSNKELTTTKTPLASSVEIKPTTTINGTKTVFSFPSISNESTAAKTTTTTNSGFVFVAPKTTTSTVFGGSLSFQPKTSQSGTSSALDFSSTGFSGIVSTKSGGINTVTAPSSSSISTGFNFNSTSISSSITSQSNTMQSVFKPLTSEQNEQKKEVKTSVFGNNETKNLTSSPFGTSVQKTQVTQSSIFGTSDKVPTSLSGASGFMSGLGKTEGFTNTTQNIFGSPTTLTSTTAQNLFSKPMISTPVSSDIFNKPKQTSFTSFSSPQNNINQQGFGAFTKPNQGQLAFGGAASFGGAPAFGSAPAFPSVPAQSISSPNTQLFGNFSTSNQTGFAQLATSESLPSFGNLAVQAPTSTFSQSPPLGSSFTSYRS